MLLSFSRTLILFVVITILLSYFCSELNAVGVQASSSSLLRQRRRVLPSLSLHRHRKPSSGHRKTQRIVQKQKISRKVTPIRGGRGGYKIKQKVKYSRKVKHG
ncbi:unnamed protein product [Didymodactylos carnosus]|uniref:Uncharacterized protein n=1 Tax=Didymodactylos carnosus TaxID=1234261 RepID=A0A815FMR5_9BILA|nr:unnamed protein product [Didymodactylos carnosus]CAF1526866.1 unnamed protein product [Didymodactylos carnosus]CAF4178474.1 unnamed protein product [Didymodactylos carnosus]CAF4313588.1 unnamed protein product [Didymodactylos carnosus]